MPLRITTWNIGWFGQLLKGYTRTLPLHSKRVTGTTALALQRLQREKIAEQILRIDPDVLCIQEGPSTGNVDRLATFCEQDLEGRWTTITRPANEPWHIRGSQGIFFLVRSTKLDVWQPRLLPQTAWFEATELESRVDINKPGSGEHNKSWPIIHPLFKPGHIDTLDEPETGDEEEGETTELLGDREHNHYRHPQTLLLTIGNKRLDIIGCHFKSKFGGDDYKKAGLLRQKAATTKAERDLIKKVEQTAVESRIKLATEVTNTRFYIDNRFRNEPDPVLFVCGDFNDGVGKEVFERKYLFHDIISNMQGNVFLSSRFLNHALFDYSQSGKENYRWSARFIDVWDPDRKPEILLDHILFSQCLSKEDALSTTGMGVLLCSGRVEHAIHNAVNAVFDREEHYTSDHRPVTLDVQLSTDVA
jgi:hypothetical protein